MKKALIILALGVLSANVSAKEGEYWYVGLDILNTKVKHSNKLNLVELDGTPYTEQIKNLSKETSFGLNIGRQVPLSSNLACALEFEYINFGSYTGTKDLVVNNIPYESNAIGVDLTTFNLNLKPKYYVPGMGLYLGALIGVGGYRIEFSKASTSSGSTTGFNYGVELGYAVSPVFDVSLGYRAAVASFEVANVKDDYEMDITSFYFGGKYKF
ncbi:outer membrane beta-barrel protein [Vibrio caribbeanicus]|uniref:Outer membrane protein beta-barrel domain-containing protein n=1 Tax=Vibrio caribbeanicus ATCC BAA-2122 TaxID=796620 RepID=E3BL24_9VIBR|nr:outer membrane beta-barrel protein [Vibrio caribbeanicus]EFP96368.1 hypothetical protein VIBC2010_12404 [Vibrio caribbeanicus ATCC BAA-2122]